MICGTRYGNVMASRGSVIPLFVEQLQAGKPLTVTDPDMTRFMMTLDDAVDLVLYAFERGQAGDIFVQKAPARPIGTLARAILELLDRPDHPIDVIGTRHGEKLYRGAAQSRGDGLCGGPRGLLSRAARPARPELRQVRRKGERRISESTDYNSHNTTRLDVEGMKELLLKLAFMRDLISGRPAEPVD